jgi:hypothetical protein
LKPKVWQELCNDTDNIVRMIRVEDHGLARSTRKQARTKQRVENKQEDELEAAKCKPGRQPKPYKNLKEMLKTTSPTKVKIASPRRTQKPTLESTRSPSLKRLKPRMIAKIAPGTSQPLQKARNSPNKTKTFKQILSRWENLSTIKLTPAVRNEAEIKMPYRQPITSGVTKLIIEKLEQPSKI